MILERKREIAGYIAWLEETGALETHQSPWNMPLLPMKKSGLLMLMNLILLEKHTVSWT